MIRIRRAAPLGTAVALALVGAVPAEAADNEALNQYVVSGKHSSPQELALKGYDVLEGSKAKNGTAIIATAQQADKLKSGGTSVSASTGVSQQAMRQVDATGTGLPAPTHGYNVFRPWSLAPAPCPGTCARPLKPLKQLYADLAGANRQFVTKRVLGRSLRGQEVVAYKVSGPGRGYHGKPAVLYESTQHAREWIAAEVEYRLFKYVLDHARDRSTEIPRILRDTNLWFIPIVNPDGYDYTFTSPASRLWRKNLRDVNGDGQITNGDGVDPNRNWPSHWNFDLEGSSNDSTTETYHGLTAGSEPEVQAARSLIRSEKPKFMIDYHSFAQLILYPFGFQVETPSTDTPLLAALGGDDRKPAVPGFDPDVSAELYTTNGDVTDDAYTSYNVLPYTVELDGGTGAAVGGTDGSDANYKPNGFVFQDDDAAIEAEFQKNLPFALDLAKSAGDPENATSHLGNTVPDMVPTTFDTSDGSPQTVEVNARRSLGNVTAKYKINGGPTRSASTHEWSGGTRFGGGGVYFHTLRGEVSGAHVGDSVSVWFEAGHNKQTTPFTYTQRQASGGDVLLLAAEDATGNSSDPPSAPQAGSKYVATYTQALSDAHRSFNVWDTDANGRKAPSALGVLSHYKSVLWETGDDLYTREPGQPGGTGVSKILDDEILAVRSFINEGGKLIVTGKHDLQGARDNFLFNPLQAPGAPYCNTNQATGNGDADDPPGQPENCIGASDDFLQYWLGAYLPISLGTDPAAIGQLPFVSQSPFGSLGFTLNGADSAGNQNASSSFVTTSSILPTSTYPQFTSNAAVKIDRPPAFDPPTGTHYAVGKSSDASYQRLRKTVDLSGLSAGQAADLSFKFSYDTEDTYDYVFVEAHTVGQDDWTTLPDANGNTTTDVGSSCDIDWDTLHPFLAHYQTNPVQDGGANGGDCTNTGTTGAWNAATGNSGGFQNWKIDLSAYAGKQVEVSITYAQDFASDGLGAYVDDATVTANGSTVDSTSFEDGLGGWTAGPPPDGTANQAGWASLTTVGLVDAPGVATDRTVLWGFGLEGVTGRDNRATLVGDTLHGLGVG
jgi:hypothetical protein